MHCHALVVLLEHPREGYILFDTGYAHRRLLAATNGLPYRFYRRIAPFCTTPEEAAVAVLSSRFGITAPQIKTVIVSHFHPDHLSGLGDFPNAQIIACPDGYHEASGLKGIRALARGILPDLLPADFLTRAGLLPVPFSGELLQDLGPTHDLYGDGLLKLVRLPGHARGQIGLLAETERGPMFFVADAAYTRRSIRENRPPHRMTNLFTEGAESVSETLGRLHKFSIERPDVCLIPTHCPEACREWNTHNA
jgi:glyoxylase-like metal-dependent hydrolase (beta-lactamase superfamily II)